MNCGPKFVSTMFPRFQCTQPVQWVRTAIEQPELISSTLSAFPEAPIQLMGIPRGERQSQMKAWLIWLQVATGPLGNMGKRYILVYSAKKFGICLTRHPIWINPLYAELFWRNMRIYRCWCKTAITPVCYCILALSHRYFHGLFNAIVPRVWDGKGTTTLRQIRVSPFYGLSYTAKPVMAADDLATQRAIDLAKYSVPVSQVLKIDDIHFEMSSVR